MPRERGSETLAQQRTSVEIVINRAALGDAEHVFAILESVEGLPNFPAYVSRKDITIKEQPLRGETLRGTLEVDVVEEHDSFYIVETERAEGIKVRLKVSKKGHKLLALGTRAIVSEDIPTR